MKHRPRWTPSAEQAALWLTSSGNTINGVGESVVRRPSPIYWHARDATPHGPLQLWFTQRTTPLVHRARQERQAAMEAQVPHGGPLAYAILLVPAAIAAGLGALGTHGSRITRTLGSNLRLACVLTDVPLVADRVDRFDADTFCDPRQACTNACPPQAIGPDKRVVRGEQRWYVDVDRCLPFVNEHQGCAVCLSVCPWNHPGVAPTLVRTLAARRERQAVSLGASLGASAL